MQQENSYDTRFQDIAYDQAVSGFYEHPYGSARFDLVERQRIEAVLSERDLVQSGEVDSAVGPRLGELLGVQYVVFVDLNNLSSEPVDGSSFSLGGVSIGGSGHRVNAQVTLTMVDTETGLIVARSTGRVNEVVGESLSFMGTSANVGSDEGALLTVLPKAINSALNDLFQSLTS